MADAPARVLLLVNLVVPLVLFMAAVYLLLHILFARVLGRTDSTVLWFFSVVTGPLTRPVRALLPPGTPEPRVRAVSLAVYTGLWIVARLLLTQLGGPARG